MNYVLVPADKAANNAVVALRLYYIYIYIYILLTLSLLTLMPINCRLL